MKFGNECYTWFMRDSGVYYENQLERMIRVTAEAGMKGIEPIFHWMGDLSDPALLKDVLAKYGVELASVAFVQDWNHATETDEEKLEAQRVFDFLKHFPDAMLVTVQMPTGRHELEQRRKNLVANLNAVSRRAADLGIESSYHPNSPESSINRTEEDYAVILEGLDASVTGWCPDVGHIINGGMDPLGKMKEYAEMINFVHFKDWDGEPEFALMGEGKVDLLGITHWLKDRGYDGWIICEDEGVQALEDPDGVTIHDGKWIHEELLPRLG